MRIITFLFSLVVFCFSQFSSASPLPKDALYDFKAETKNTYPESIANILTKEKFTQIKEEGAPFVEMGMSWLSRLFIDKDGKYIMSRAHLTLPDKIKHNEIYEQNGDYVYHQKVDGFETVAFYFSGFTKSEVQTYINKFARTKALNLFPTYENLKSYGFSFLVDKAFAEESKDKESDGNICKGEAIKENLSEKDQGSFTGNVWGCLKGAGAGLYNSTLGAAATIFKGAGNILQGNVSGVWSSMKSTYNNITSAIGNISGTMNQVSDSWKALSSEQKSKLTCEVLSSLGIAAFTGAAMMPNTIAKLSKAADTMAKATKLDKVGAAIGSVAKPVGNAIGTFAAAAAERAKALASYIPFLNKLGVDKKVVSALSVSEARLARLQSTGSELLADEVRLKNLLGVRDLNKFDAKNLGKVSNKGEVIQSTMFNSSETVAEAAKRVSSGLSRNAKLITEEKAHLIRVKLDADKLAQGGLSKLAPAQAQEFLKSKKALGLLIAGNACSLASSNNPDADIDISGIDPSAEQRTTQSVQEEKSK